MECGEKKQNHFKQTNADSKRELKYSILNRFMIITESVFLI
ncbi:unnamed protein product [Paramecium octaurelia]|uniref:Uncharacterized protein n=1 Tax=Paramecium octaurelia TaxID=43137 RepID=A0A8S1Y414_PAROT|nr:unnamed protein product [Paramecium octaurelia]